MLQKVIITKQYDDKHKKKQGSNEKGDGRI